jgi:hypothetical protein
MLRLPALTLLLLAVTTTAPVQAQQTMSTFITGADPHHINPVRIDTSQAFRPAGNTFRPLRPLQMLNPVRVFRNFQFPISWPPRIGGSAFPNTPTTFPGATTTKVATTGAN